MGKQDFWIKDSEFDNSQLEVLNAKSNESLVVRGCAGSGKSLLALRKLHEIVSNNMGTAQVIVYTKALRDFFAEGCRGHGIDVGLIDPEFPGVLLTTNVMSDLLGVACVCGTRGLPIT